MKPRIQLLAIDIDGTLLNSRWELPAANLDAVVAAEQRGVEIVLVTGRRFTFAQPIANQLPVDWTLISSGGAVVKSKQGETLAQILLPRRMAREVLAAMGEFRNSALLLFDHEEKGQIVAESFHPSHESVQGYLERNQRYLIRVERLEDSLNDEDPIQILFAGTFSDMREAGDLLESLDCHGGFAIARTEYPDRDFTLIDVLHPECDKGAALAEWARRRGIAAENVMAIGDNWNDVAMLEFAGVPVLMGNSAEELQQRGWHVTATHDDDGVAQAIKKFILPE